MIGRPVAHRQHLHRLLGTVDDGRDLDAAIDLTARRTRSELPLRWSIGLQDDCHLDRLLQLSADTRQRYHAQRMLLANLIDAHQRNAGKRVFYSRDHNHYAAVRGYAPRHYRHAAIIAAVDNLETAGLIAHRRTKASPRADLRSCLWPTERLASVLRSAVPNDLCLAAPPPIVLRDEHKHPVALPRSARIRRLTEDVKEHNAFLDRVTIRLEHPDVHIDGCGNILCRGLRHDGRRSRYFRVFNRSMQQGGRWFGPYWQSQPADIRAALTIEGEPVVEVDFRACHLRLLGALHGIIIDAEASDPFALPGHRRADLKLTFNVLVNASSERQARRALAGEFRTEYGSTTCERVGGLIAAVRTRWPGFAASWFTGIGRRLQNIDSNICARVQRRLRHTGIPCLSVHDSFIVPASHSKQLISTMDDELSKAQSKLVMQVKNGLRVK